MVEPEPQTASQLRAKISAPRDDAAGVHSLALQTQDVVMSNPHSTSHVVEGHGVATVATVGADNVVSHSETAAQLESKPVLLANSAQLSAVDPLGRLPVDEVKRVARGLRLLNLCGGPVRPKDGLDLYVEEWGAKILTLDIVRSLEHDLLDEGRWSSIREELCEARYDGLGNAAPCSTFSAGRKYDGGPRPLRGEYEPEIFGLKGLTPEEKTKVREGTLIAMRCFEACGIMHKLNRPFWFETPARQTGEPSVFKLPVAVETVALAGVDVRKFMQCMLEAISTKPTEMILFMIKGEWLPPECAHPQRWWILPWTGESQWRAHPPLTGRQLMIPWEKWQPGMLRRREPDGPYITREAAHYSGKMNKVLAEYWVRGCVAERLRYSQAQSLVASANLRNGALAKGVLPPATHV